MLHAHRSINSYLCHVFILTFGVTALTINLVVVREIKAMQGGRKQHVGTSGFDDI